MSLAINSHRLQSLIQEPFIESSSRELRRQEGVVFIGASLPVLETLETMYESHCQNPSTLFYITFGNKTEWRNNLELVRQIKKNFSVRMVGRIDFELLEAHYEQVYLAGLDNVDIPMQVCSDTLTRIGSDRLSCFMNAGATFPRWALISSLHISDDDIHKELRGTIDMLLGRGIIPLLTISRNIGEDLRNEVTSHFGYLADAWQRYDVPIKPLLPLVQLMSPLESGETRGIIRGVIDRIHDRRILATSDLRRHLRTKEAEASFESAGL